MRLKVLTRALPILPFLLIQAVSAHAATITFTANLLGSNETPPNSSPATGLGTFIFDTIAQDIIYTVSYSGLTSNSTMAHIHFGPVGTSGPIILPFRLAPSALPAC